MDASPPKAKPKLDSARLSFSSSRVAKLYEQVSLAPPTAKRVRIRRPARIHTYKSPEKEAKSTGSLYNTQFEMDEHGDRVPVYRLNTSTGEREYPVIHRHTVTGVFLRAMWADHSYTMGNGLDMQEIEARVRTHMDNLEVTSVERTPEEMAALLNDDRDTRVTARMAAVSAGEAVPLADETLPTGMWRMLEEDDVPPADSEVSTNDSGELFWRPRQAPPGNPDAHHDFSDRTNYNAEGQWIGPVNAGSREWRHADDGYHTTVTGRTVSGIADLAMPDDPLTHSDDELRAYHRRIHRETGRVVRWARSLPERFTRWRVLHITNDLIGIFVLLGLVAFIGFMLNVMKLGFN